MVGVLKSLGYFACGPVGLVHIQNLRFLYKEKPTCGFGECPLWMEERTLSISGSRSAFDPGHRDAIICFLPGAQTRELSGKVLEGRPESPCQESRH
jgi:hypothetical protein